MNNPWGNIPRYAYDFATSDIGQKILMEGYNKYKRYAKPRVNAGIRKKYNNSTLGLRMSMNKEKKYHDVTIGRQQISASSTRIADSLNLIDQGTTAQTRIGNVAFIKDINMNVTVDLPATLDSGNGADIIRIILCKDKQANGSTTSFSEIFNTAQFDSYRNLSLQKRFDILWDKSYILNSSSSGDGTSTRTSLVMRNKRKAIQLKKTCTIEYSGTGGGITDIASCNFCMFAITSKGLAYLQAKIRVRYTD